MPKLDLKRVLLGMDEKPFPKTRDRASGEVVEELLMVDLLRDVYSSNLQDNTQEDRAKKGRLGQKLNQAFRKGEKFHLSEMDATYTLKQAGKYMEPVLYIQLEDLIHERKTVGEDGAGEDDEGSDEGKSEKETGQ